MTDLDFVYQFNRPRKAYRKARWRKAKVRFLIRERWAKFWFSYT